MPSNQGEHWKDVLGYKNMYQVSDYGRVRSLDRVVKTKIGRRLSLSGKTLKILPDTHGYSQVTLSKKGKPKTFRVHQLVAAAFLGKCPTRLECCHKDGVQTNNRLENVRYDTRKANHADKKRHGTYVEGSLHSKAKLTEKTVKTIRDDYASGGRPISWFAKKYGVNYITIHRVLTRKRWKHVGGADCSGTLRKNLSKGGAILTPVQVKEIRKLYEKKSWTVVRLAEAYGVGERNMYDIIAYRKWKDV